MTSSAAAPSRTLGLYTATALVVASMVGTGVFTTSGLLLQDLKSPWAVLAAWLLGGVLAVCGALSYGDLVKRMPESGGEYLFLSRMLHPAAGNMAGWVSLLVGFSAPLAAAAFGFGEYVKAWLPGCSPLWPGTVLLCACAAIHAIRPGGGVWLQNFAVTLNVLLMLAFVAYAAPHLPHADWRVSLSGDREPGAFPLALVWVSFSYAGWNAAVYIAAEVVEPERVLPRALLTGTVLVAALYLALNTAFLFAAPAAELAGKTEVARIAALALGGQAGADAVAALVALALATSASALMMAGPRVYARMAQDGYLPRLFQGGIAAPRASIALQCALALALLWSTAFRSLLTYIGFTLGLSTAAAVIGLMCTKWRHGPSFSVTGWPLVPAVFLAGVVWMVAATVWRQPLESLWGLLTFALGWLNWRLSRPAPAVTAD
ncbi:APC family permease [Methylococcus sp. EFPC2]|uniref:APC family permease n=1 Tax=Methylococcus sp. EFPC2 TaxID=2812648 RepID=UPI00196704E1|nr:amino acid permease [Methylococcus sp. EFPC2]QSA97538.1 amino acid permease [Methylococcus sp. EFPC2]